MFTDAIAKVSQFTRPLMSISRTYGSINVNPGLATMFFVNDSGCAVTCKHVAEQLMQADSINKKFRGFHQQLDTLRETHPEDFEEQMRLLEKEFGYRPGAPITIKYNIVTIPSPFKSFTIHTHPKYDLAIIQFSGYEDLHYNAEHIRLLDKDEEIRQGNSLCRLGFPFPEFKNFQYNAEKDDIEWISGPPHVPSFPMDGIVTRHLADKDGSLFGIEISAPGLRGQSGGRLFGAEGRIYGMQSSTKHLYLGFDIEKEVVMSNGQKKEISNQPFLHVGQCVHVRIIKEFLDQHNIPYQTA